MEKKARNFREYQVGNDAVKLSTAMYKQTGAMPYEVETQPLISQEIGCLENDNYKALNSMAISIECQLSRLIKTLRKQ